MNKLLCLTGPTASGKTALAVRLAQSNGLNLINADAFQFYKEIPIISNQDRQSPVPIRYLGFRSMKEPMTSGEYARMVEADLRPGNLMVGTGLYISAALYGLDQEKGTPFQKAPKVDYEMIVLSPERARLYGKINSRVDQMIELGAVQEARSIYEKIQNESFSKELSPLKAIGLKHLLAYFDGGMSWDQTVELWKRDTRRLAKRQWTWLRKFCPPSDFCRWITGPDEI